MKWCLWIALTFISSHAFAECSASNSEKRISLLELYTSEGCSSCPPADKWLSRLEASGFTKEQVVILAFHVDYWDYIGWKDRYAKAEFSNRQRHAAAMHGSSIVYTPQFMLNGTDFRGGLQDQRLQIALSQNNNRTAKAQIGLNLAPVASDSGKNSAFKLTTTVNTTDPDVGRDADVFIAIYENQLESAIQAGENKGKELSHDYVVREWLGPLKLNKLTQRWQQETFLSSSWQNRNAGVAAFVQNRNTGEIIQATSMKICS
ncbi:MAG: DUF1223 domain-containing protein [Betaproteobacteria bacterium HGW-Betaproteobacteria-8]|nr:MAG: DUF1223 domain-containing protein [Betaproteobacteria bacterium HGW-Betaproteobacteria-8]